MRSRREGYIWVLSENMIAEIVLANSIFTIKPP